MRSLFFVFLTVLPVSPGFTAQQINLINDVRRPFREISLSVNRREIEMLKVLKGQTPFLSSKKVSVPRTPSLLGETKPLRLTTIIQIGPSPERPIAPRAAPGITDQIFLTEIKRIGTAAGYGALVGSALGVVTGFVGGFLEEFGRSLRTNLKSGANPKISTSVILKSSLYYGLELAGRRINLASYGGLIGFGAVGGLMTYFSLRGSL